MFRFLGESNANLRKRCTLSLICEYFHVGDNMKFWGEGRFDMMDVRKA
jgi:hypothetical protein